MSVTYHNTLAIGTRLEEYELLEVLGEGGFGITYRAYDHQLRLDVAIKEYLPSEWAVRTQNGSTVVARSSSGEDNYRYGLSRFLDEARTLARFNHPNIVRVLRFIEANGTAYLVMDFEEGKTLSNYLRSQTGPMTEQAIIEVFMPIMDGLREVHALGLLHRDIKPGNIYLRSKGTPMLIDFGAARQAVGERSKSLSVIVTQGYAPLEQYSSRGKQGAWSDIYALGATMHRCISGAEPVEASVRLTTTMDQESDPLPPAVECGKGRYSEPLLQAVDWMLKLNPRDRPQCIREVHDLLHGHREIPTSMPGRSPSAPTDPQAATTDAQAKSDMVSGSTSALIPRSISSYALGIGVLFMAMIVAAAVWLLPRTAWWQDYQDPIIEHVLSGHTGYVRGVAFSPDGKLLASASWDGSVRLWNVATGKPDRTMEQFPHYVYRVGFSPDGKWLVSSGISDEARLYNLADGPVPPKLEGAYNISSETFDREGRLLLLRDLPQAILAFAPGSAKPIQEKVLPAISDSAIYEGEISADGQFAVTQYHEDGVSLRIFKVADARQLWQSDAFRSRPEYFAFSADNQLLVAASTGEVRVFDMTGGMRYLTDDQNPRSLAFSPDLHLLAVGNSDGAINLRDAKSGSLLATLSGHTAAAYVVAFSADGRRLASGADDNAIRIWDVRKRLSGAAEQKATAGPNP